MRGRQKRNRKEMAKHNIYDLMKNRGNKIRGLLLYSYAHSKERAIFKSIETFSKTDEKGEEKKTKNTQNKVRTEQRINETQFQGFLFKIKKSLAHCASALSVYSWPIMKSLSFCAAFSACSPSSCRQTKKQWIESHCFVPSFLCKSNGSDFACSCPLFLPKYSISAVCLAQCLFSLALSALLRLHYPH